MHEPTARPERTRRASLREAVPTAAQWACCPPGAVMVMVVPDNFAPAWQVMMYQVAHRLAVESVEADRARAESARWN